METANLEYRRGKWNSQCSGEMRRYQDCLLYTSEEKEDEEFIRKYKILMKTPVYVDSPLAISATEVFSDNMDLFDEEMCIRDRNQDFQVMK